MSYKMRNILSKKMQNRLTLYSLCENCHCDSSRIVYYDGLRRHLMTFSDLYDSVSFISQILNDLLLSEQNIGCLIRPSLALPSVILGILKVSSTFAFLDIHKPLERLQNFQKYLEIKTLLIEDDYLKDLKLCSCWKKLSGFHKFSDFTILKSSQCKNENCPNKRQYKTIKEAEVAYAIQTSGTTGEAKVVQVPHDCIISNIIDLRSRFSVTSNDVILQSTRLTFDPSIIEIFLSLSSGASLVIVADHIKSIPQKLIEVIAKENITIFQKITSDAATEFFSSFFSCRSMLEKECLKFFDRKFTAEFKSAFKYQFQDRAFIGSLTWFIPALFEGTPSLICNFGEDVLKNTLLCEESVLKILAFGGETCPSIHKLLRWKSKGNKTEIYNLYGLTELSCWASCFKIDFESINLLSSIPIGDPLLDTKFEIHDEDGEIADRGELYIGGGSKRFCIINDEKVSNDLEHFLRPTGDFVTKSPDGFIYFEGRKDNVIKHMGHKVSLNLVNDTVEKFPDIANHVLHYHSPSAKLYLFITWLSKPISESKRKQNLLKSLKDKISKLPAVIIVPVAFIPLTEHGKGDIKKLMNLVNEAQTRRSYPESLSDKDIDNIISSLWKSYTHQPVILDNDSFTEKGGDSIAAVHFATEIEWQLQLQLPLLVEKLLNKHFKEVKDYVKYCFKDDLNPKNTYEFYSSASAHQPVKKRKCCDISYCFKVCSKQESKEHCKHTSHPNNCFHKISNSFKNLELHLNLAFTWDLKKCIDATPCILYLPHLSELLIFIGSHYGMFSCIDVHKRSEKWQVLVEDRIESSACVSACGCYVLFGCYDHHLYCINITNGTIHWKYKTAAEVKSSPSVSYSNSVFVGSHDKHVYAIEVQSGRLLWKSQVAYGSIFSSPAVIEDIDAICVGTLDGILALLKMASGDILWQYNAQKPLFSSPLVTSNFILIGSTDKYLLCLDFNGRKKFDFTTEGPIFSSAANCKDCEDQVVFGCHDSFVYCITLGGNLIWKTLCDSAVYATPCIFKFNSIYYVCTASSQGTIYFFELSNGKIIFSFKCSGEIFSSPVILNDILAIGCRDNNIYCFNLGKCINNVK